MGTAVRVILDTSVLVARVSTGAGPDLIGLECGLSSVSYGELNFGISIAKTDEARLARTANLHRIVSIFGSGIPYDDTIASSYGFLFGRARQAGQTSRRRTSDIMIAATAHSLGVPLVTRNTTDLAVLVHVLEIIER